MLFSGQAIAATAVILIKVNQFHPFALAAYRLLFAVVVLSPLYLRDLRRLGLRLNWQLVRPSILPGAFLAVHFMSWNIGARNTVAANASLIVNMLPVFLPIVLLALTREKPRWYELVATAIALSGLLVLGIPSFQGSRATLLGDVVSFASMLFLACYLAFGRRNRQSPSLWLYVTPVYLVAGLLALITTVVAGVRIGTDFSTTNVLTLAGIVLGPTVLGHSAVNFGMRRLPSQLVALSQVTQPVWAGTLAYLLLDEVPHPFIAIAAVAIIAGIVITIRGHARDRRAANQTAHDDT
ncbi:MAG: DMT family transporter [Spirochaetales bacterium]